MIMEPIKCLLDAVARQREQHREAYAAFMVAHGAQDIGELTREETRELFSICLMGARLDAEMAALRRLLGRVS